MKTSNFLKAPLTINWAVTNTCNFKCRHCYSRTDPSEELDGQTLFSCIEKIVAAGVLSINFGGGEPFLREDFLNILDYAHRKRITTCVSTNGTMLDEALATNLARRDGFRLECGQGTEQSAGGLGFYRSLGKIPWDHHTGSRRSRHGVHALLGCVLS